MTTDGVNDATLRLMDGNDNDIIPGAWVVAGTSETGGVMDVGEPCQGLKYELTGTGAEAMIYYAKTRI